MQRLVLLAVGLVASAALAAPTTRPSAEVVDGLDTLSWRPHGLPASEGGSVGEAVEEAGEQLVSVDKVLADPTAYAGKKIYLAGSVTSVCQKAGCWIKMVPMGGEASTTPGLDTASVFVKLTCPTEGFLVPVDSAGHPAIAYGEVVVQEYSQADARHFAEDEGASEEELAAIQGPQTVVRLMTPGVWVGRPAASAAGAASAQ